MDFFVLRGAGLFIVAFLNIFLCFLFFKKGKEGTQNFQIILIALFGAISALSSGLAYFSGNFQYFGPVFWVKLAWSGIFTLPPFLIFVYYFTGKTRYIKIKSFFLYSISIVFFFLSLATSYIVKSAYLEYPHIIIIPGKIVPLARVYMLVGLVIGAHYTLRGYFKSRGIKRLQLKYFIAGAIIYALGSSIVLGFIPLFLAEGGPYYSDMASYFSLFWIAFTGYAILRYRLFDIYLVMGRLAIYLFSAFTFIGVALAILFLNARLGFLISETTVLIVMLFFTAFTYFPVFRFFERIAGRYFYYSYYNLQLVFSSLFKQLNQTIELENLSALINRSLLDALNLDKTGIVLKFPGEEEFKPYQLIKLKEKDVSSLIQNKGFLLQYLEKTKKPLVKEEIPFLFRQENLKKDLDRLEIGVILPLLIKGKLIGLLLLGDKLSGEAYTAQDIRALASLSPHVSLAVNNAVSFEETKRRKEELEKFYKMVVGRELKMVELKKEIEKLKNEKG